MKIRKTRQDRRETYRYEAYLENDNGEYTKECIELKPGTDGVTEAWIKTLYSLSGQFVLLLLSTKKADTFCICLA